MFLSMMLGAALVSQDFGQIATKLERPDKPKLLIVGFYHFENPGLDLVKSDLDDHRSDRRQREIEQLNVRLAEFAPTKIAVEHPTESNRMQEKYELWRDGNAQLSGSETEQVGFRIAKQFGHERLYPIDRKLDLDFGAFMKSADPDTLKEFQGMIGMVQSIMATFKDRHVIENLAMLNSPAADRMGNGFYLRMMPAGTGADAPGAKVAADWYARNLYWIANLGRVAKPKDRILVICGSGHASMIRSILRDSIDFEVVDTLPYLKGR